MPHACENSKPDNFWTLRSLIK